MSLHLAKDKPRTLAYGTNLREDLKLLEVSDELLEELQGSGLSFKGNSNEEAVLCSRDMTFAVKNVETSNLVLMVDPSTDVATTPAAPSPSGAPTPPGNMVGLATQVQRNAAAASQPPVVVSAIVKAHLELVQVAPRLHALDAALADHPIGADDDEDMTEGHQTYGKTFDELVSEVQASESELKAALEERGAVCLEDRWRGVDAAYLGTLLELILLTAVEKGWDLSAIPAQETADTLAPDGYRSELVQHCLKQFSKPVLSKNDRNGKNEGDSVFALHPEAVCKHFGLKLLRERPRWESVQEFYSAWQSAVPEGMAPSMALLRGEVMLDATASEVESLSSPADASGGLLKLAVGEMPRDSESRFKMLYNVRSRWELPDLEPYLEGLAGPGETTEMLLLKYARASQQRPTDPVTYSMSDQALVLAVGRKKERQESARRWMVRGRALRKTLLAEWHGERTVQEIFRQIEKREERWAEMEKSVQRSEHSSKLSRPAIRIFDPDDFSVEDAKKRVLEAFRSPASIPEGAELYNINFQPGGSSLFSGLREEPGRKVLETPTFGGSAEESAEGVPAGFLSGLCGGFFGRPILSTSMTETVSDGTVKDHREDTAGFCTTKHFSKIVHMCFSLHFCRHIDGLIFGSYVGA